VLVLLEHHHAGTFAEHEAVAIDVPVSGWLFLCALLLALFLGLAKRRQELVSLKESATEHRPALGTNHGISRNYEQTADGSVPDSIVAKHHRNGTGAVEEALRVTQPLLRDVPG
jgi:hypothetical protein